MDQYRTIAKHAVVRLEINKSHFIGIAYPLEESTDPDQLIGHLKRVFPEASHYVYAYTLGLHQAVQKYSDDGEPSGTGGMPVLELLRHLNLKNSLVLVVRYYGGIKLGTGGLKRAYSKAAQDAVQEAGIMTLTKCRILRVVCPYAFWGKVQYEVVNRNIQIDETVYEEHVTLTVAVPQRQADVFWERIQELSGSQVFMEHRHLEYRNMKADYKTTNGVKNLRGGD